MLFDSIFLELFEKAEINHIFLDKQFLFDYTQSPSGVKQIKGFYPNHLLGGLR
jgi:hypothetical protein